MLDLSRACTGKSQARHYALNNHCLARCAAPQFRHSPKVRRTPSGTVRVWPETSGDPSRDVGGRNAMTNFERNRSDVEFPQLRFKGLSG